MTPAWPAEAGQLTARCVARTEFAGVEVFENFAGLTEPVDPILLVGDPILQDELMDPLNGGGIGVVEVMIGDIEVERPLRLMIELALLELPGQ